MLGIAHSHPLDTVEVLVVQPGKTVKRQTISWHLGSVLGGPISPTPVGDSNTADPFGVRGSSIEPQTPTQLAQKAEEVSDSSEFPKLPGSQHPGAHRPSGLVGKLHIC